MRHLGEVCHLSLSAIALLTFLGLARLKTNRGKTRF